MGLCLTSYSYWYCVENAYHAFTLLSSLVLSVLSTHSVAEHLHQRVDFEMGVLRTPPAERKALRIWGVQSLEGTGTRRAAVAFCSQPADPESALAFTKNAGGFGLVGDIQLLFTEFGWVSLWKAVVKSAKC